MSQLKIRPISCTFETTYCDEPSQQVCLMIRGDDGHITCHWFAVSDARDLASELNAAADCAEGV